MPWISRTSKIFLGFPAKLADFNEVDPGAFLFDVDKFEENYVFSYFFVDDTNNFNIFFRTATNKFYLKVQISRRNKRLNFKGL